ncbi:MAG TPA: hypothetical protein VGC01_09450 [Mucilaginibacter sp.]
MKFGGIILFMLLCGHVFAQRLNGIVIDKATGQPVPNAIIKKGFYTQVSSSYGEFSLPVARFGDTIRISSMGYKPYNLLIGMAHKDTIHVYLEPNSIILNDVNINRQRNHQLDSINNRKEFAKIFAHKTPGVMDAFIKIDPNIYRPNDYINSTNSTTSIAGLNLLSVFNLFGKNKTSESKLHELALQDEEATYLDRRFSKQRVNKLTGLQGDTLQKFVDRFRPSMSALKAMSDYELLIFIKQCYELYLKEEK